MTSAEILKKWEQPAEIIAYYVGLQQAEVTEKRALNEAKVLVVGQGSVGKTSLVKQLIHNQFDERETQTKGIDIQKWVIEANGTEVQLNVWDFGGQEIMHATHQFFLTRRSLYLLVLDARLEKDENRVEYWLKIIESFGGDAPVIVVGNKIDQRQLDLGQRELRAKYPNIRAIVETSCLTSTGFDELRALIAQEVGRLEHIHNELLNTWFAVKSQLEAMKEQKIDYISYDAYRQMCEAEGIGDALSQRTLIGLLHELGVVLHFEATHLLGTNVINPDWVTQGVYQIINSNELFQSKGILEARALDQMLDPTLYPPEKHPFILEVMRQFELCIEFEGSKGDRYLVPDLLSRDEPYTGEWDDALAFQYRYDVLPGSVISRFIVRMHPYVYQNTYWRNGVVLASRDGQNKALVKADPDDGKMSIHVQGHASTRRDLLRFIRDDFEKIHATISGLAPTEEVPLLGHPGISIGLQELLNLAKKGIQTYYYAKIDDDLDVRALLEGIESPDERRGEDIDLKRDVLRRPEPPTLPQPTPQPVLVKKESVWGGRVFFLVAFVVVMATLAVIANFVHWSVLPLVLIGGLLAFPLINVFIALSEGKLTGKNVTEIVLASYRQLPLLKGKQISKGNEEPKKVEQKKPQQIEPPNPPTG